MNKIIFDLKQIIRCDYAEIELEEQHQSHRAEMIGT
jgi:hypothetical protein